jgi:hypothetical protein
MASKKNLLGEIYGAGSHQKWHRHGIIQSRQSVASHATSYVAPQFACGKGRMQSCKDIVPLSACVISSQLV